MCIQLMAVFARLVMIIMKHRRIYFNTEMRNQHGRLGWRRLLPLLSVLIVMESIAMPLDIQALELQSGRMQNVSLNSEGQVVLIVNTPAYCDKPSQYEGLQALYRRFRDRGFQVLAFTSRQFTGRSYGSNHHLLEECRTKFRLSYPLFAPSDVAGDQANGLFKWLSSESGVPPEQDFTKYLLDRNGELVKVFSHDVRPDDLRLSNEINRLLTVKRPIIE